VILQVFLYRPKSNLSKLLIGNSRFLLQDFSILLFSKSKKEFVVALFSKKRGKLFKMLFVQSGKKKGKAIRFSSFIILCIFKKKILL
jgi:hypothetical protein